ncbi:hypothetical protein CR513_21960, partial [Mucuna pruriens]
MLGQDVTKTVVSQMRDQQGKDMQEEERKRNDGGPETMSKVETKAEVGDQHPHRGTIATIARRGATERMSRLGRRRSVVATPKDLVISFLEVDYDNIQLDQDNLMVISIVVANCKVERVLVDQGSLANVLFWMTFQKLGMAEEKLEACLSTLIGFVGEQVEIWGTIDLQTTFGAGSDVKIIPFRFTRSSILQYYPRTIGSKPATGDSFHPIYA